MDKIVSKMNAEAQFQFNRGTATEWAENDIVLAEGEPALLLDENKKTIGIKYGDGKKKFSELELTGANVDLNYDPESENAQSGKAVAEAIDNALDGIGNSFASAIKQTVSGDVVVANDVSPIQHELKVSVNRKNLLQYPYPATTKTVSGVTITANHDGSLTLNGTATAAGMYAFDLGTSFLTEDVYTVSLFSAQETQDVFLNGTYDGSASKNIYIYTSESATVHISKQISLYLYFINGAVFENLVVKPQIEKGSSATNWEPCIDLSTVNVSRYGKNLCDNIFEKGEISSSTGANQTNTSVYSVRTKNYIPILPNTEYTMTNPVKSKSRKVRYYKKDKSFLSTSSNFISSGTDSLIRTATTPNGAYYMRIQIDCDTTDLATEIRNGNHKYQFELGSSATPYEECNIKTVNANAEGTVKGITSVTPSMTLLVNKNSVTLECEYNVDTKTYIDNKFAELSAAILNS